MELVNPLTAFVWNRPLDINGVAMAGVKEKRGHSFSRAGYLAALDDPTLDADAVGRAVRRQLRPLSKPMLDRARAEYAARTVIPFPRYFIIEPNASCNRKCVFCPIIVTNRKGNMKWEHFTKLMTECANYGVYGISLYQLSEPMLYRGKVTEFGGMGEYRFDITDMVDAAKRVGHFRSEEHTSELQS